MKGRDLDRNKPWSASKFSHASVRPGSGTAVNPKCGLDVCRAALQDPQVRTTSRTIVQHHCGVYPLLCCSSCCQWRLRRPLQMIFPQGPSRHSRRVYRD